MSEYDEKIKVYGEKLGKDVSAVKSELKSIYETLKKQYPKLNDKELRKKTMRRLFIRYKREILSPAKWWEGVFIGDTGIIDLAQRRRAIAVSTAKKDMERAVEEGLMDAQGQVLDRRGRVLPEHQYIRIGYGIVKGNTQTEYHFSSILQGRLGELYKLQPPLFKYCKFRATEGQVYLGIPTLNSTSVTQFDTVEKEFDLMAMLKKTMKDYLVPLKALEKWHQDRLQAPAQKRIMITEGDVIDIRPLGDRTMMFLWDEGLPDDQNVAVFSGNHLNDYIQFEPESRILVFGRTGTGRILDRETGKRVAGGVNISAFGIYPTEIVPKIPQEVVAGEEKQPKESEEELW